MPAENEIPQPIPRRVVPVGYMSEWSLSRLARGERASVWSLISDIPGPAKLMVYIERREADRIMEEDSDAR